MDNVDHRIVNLLRREVRISRTRLGEKFRGLSSDDMEIRLCALEASGAVQRYYVPSPRGTTTYEWIMLTHATTLEPTTMSPARFTERFNELRVKHGALGILELQGLAQNAIAEGIALERNENPTLRQALVIVELLARRMVRVLPYQVRLARNIDEEVQQLAEDPSFTSMSSPTAVYARLSMYGYESTLINVRKALGFPLHDQMALDA